MFVSYIHISKSETANSHVKSAQELSVKGSMHTTEALRTENSDLPVSSSHPQRHFTPYHLITLFTFLHMEDCVIQVARGSHRTTWWYQLSPSSLWVLSIKFKLLLSGKRFDPLSHLAFSAWWTFLIVINVSSTYGERVVNNIYVPSLKSIVVSVLFWVSHSYLDSSFKYLLIHTETVSQITQLGLLSSPQGLGHESLWYRPGETPSLKHLTLPVLLYLVALP